MKKFILFCISLIILLILANVLMNQNIFISKYHIVSDKYSGEAVGFKMLQLSDIHSLRSEEQIEHIIKKVKKVRPNVIFITGDLVDSTYYEEENNRYLEGLSLEIESYTIQFMKNLMKLAPVYYVYGNHEMILLDDPINNAFKVAVEDMGVIILNNKIDTITVGDNTINVVGVQDPATLYKDKTYANVANTHRDTIRIILDDLFAQLTDEQKENYTVLLTHRPEYFELYANYPIDLAFTGHTHGGLIRIPWVGGLYAHPDGFFPKYSGGLYSEGDFNMIVNRGVGHAKVPVRFLNPPEIVTVVLSKEDILP